MRKVLFTFFLCSFVFCLLKAADPLPPATTPNPQQISEDEAFKQQINDLINKRRQVSMDIYRTRVELINTDSNFRIMHQAIMDLHQKMAKQLNDNPKIVALIDKGKEIDKEITQAVQDYQDKKGNSK